MRDPATFRFECSAVERGFGVEFTNLCGYSCRNCARRLSPDFGSMTEGTFAAVLRAVRGSGYREMMVSGLGDAFLHPDPVGFAARATAEMPGLSVYFMTKGQALTDAHARDLGALAASGARVGLTFSVYSLDPARYADMTGGALSDLLSAVERARRAGVPFAFEFLVTAATAGEVPRFRELAGRLGVHYALAAEHDWGGRLPGAVRADAAFRSRPAGTPCPVISAPYLYFDRNGDVHYCSLNDLDPRGRLGNVHDAGVTFASLTARRSALDFPALCGGCARFRG